MKKFFDGITEIGQIVLCSTFISAFTAWIWLPLYLLLLWICNYIWTDPLISEKVSIVVVTAIAVAFSSLVVKDEPRKKLENDIEILTKNISEIRERSEEALRIEQIKFSRAIQKARREQEALEAKLEMMERDFDAYLKDTAQSSPWLAAKIADTAALVDKELIRQLRSKKNPALKAAEQVKEISKEKKELLRRNKELEYQLQFYEGLFPWLEEFKTLPAPEAVQYVHYVDSDYDKVSFWLSPEEYAELSSSERNQLALDRYMKRKKSDWDVGIEYERYIGYLYESGGYLVTYNGATQGLSDMGRDIVAVKDKETRVIQCKRWAKDKEIHEKHIFQLYGTTVLMRLENGKRCDGVFVTTARLSPLAMSCAKFLKIIVAEELKYKPYPLIKCNVSKTGEKIYHLPFDQQYDRVQISGKDGAMFAWTVAEAEANGFRRAKRWVPDKP